MELVICWHIDADGDIERALQYDKAEEAARISQGVEAGNRILESWVLRSHGRMLDEAGVSGSAQLSAEYLEDVADIVRQVEEATNARMHVGIGAEPSEAVIARKIAEERGGDPAIVLYTPDLSDEARKLDELSDDEANDLELPGDDGIVGGGEPAGGGELGKAEQGQKQPGEATQVAQGQLSPTAAAPSPPPSASISAGSPSAQQGQPPQAPQGEPSDDDVLQGVGQVLEQFKAQLPLFEQMKQSNPQAYQAVMSMVQGMIAMAQRLAGGSSESTPPPGAKEGAPVKKSEVDRRDKENRSKDSRTTLCARCGNPVDVNSDGTPQPHSSRSQRSGKVGPCNGTTIVNLNKSESTKVELEPHKKLPSVSELRKLFDTINGDQMAMGEKSPSDKSFHEFVVGFEHEAKEHPHLDANQAALTAKQHLDEDPEYYSKLKTLEATKVIGEGSSPMAKGERLAKTAALGVCGKWMTKPGEKPKVGDRSCTKLNDHAGPHDADYRACKNCGKPPGKGNCKRLDGWECEHHESSTYGEKLDKAAMPASRHHVVLPPGSVGVGGRARSVKVVEPVTGKTSWHQVSTGQKLSGDNHTLSTRVAECPSADTPERRAQEAGLVGVPSATKPGQTAGEDLPSNQTT